MESFCAGVSRRLPDSRRNEVATLVLGVSMEHRIWNASLPYMLAGIVAVWFSMLVWLTTLAR